MSSEDFDLNKIDLSTGIEIDGCVMFLKKKNKPKRKRKRKPETSEYVDLPPDYEVVYYEDLKKIKYVRDYAMRTPERKIPVAEPVREDAFRNIFGGKLK